MKIAYFVGGGLGAITSSNFLKISARIIPAMTHPIVIVLGVVVLVGLAVALLWEDTEECLKLWFLGLLLLSLGVMLGAV